MKSGKTTWQEIPLQNFLGGVLEFNDGTAIPLEEKRHYRGFISSAAMKDGFPVFLVGSVYKFDSKEKVWKLADGQSAVFVRDIASMDAARLGEFKGLKVIPLGPNVCHDGCVTFHLAFVADLIIYPEGVTPPAEPNFFDEDASE